jgi:hypothetical protein
MTDPTHVAFSDESHHNFGRYRGIGMVTLCSENHIVFDTELKTCLRDSGLVEFKWSDLSSAQHRFAALKLVDWCFEKLLNQCLRIDVLIWDTQDSRHTIQGRDDMANLERMYYHLFRNVLNTRWPDGSRWKLFRDEQSAIDWHKMNEVLHYVSSTTEHQRDLSGLTLRIKTEFSIQQICPCLSHEHGLVQVSDLFVGLGVYSRTSYDRYRAWLASRDSQERFDFDTVDNPKLSRADKERCTLLSTLDERCKKAKLRVSLKTSRGLRSLNPASPLNFWWYQPQADYDKAPTKR